MRIINTIAINALYWSSKKDYFEGYIKLTVRSVVAELSQRIQFRPHSIYPVSFIPFTSENEQYRLRKDRALELQDVTAYNSLKRKWLKIPLLLPQREQERFSSIIAYVESRLPEFIFKYAESLAISTPTHCRFLGEFPEPLRQEAVGTMYGTCSSKKPSRTFMFHDTDLLRNLETRLG